MSGSETIIAKGTQAVGLYFQPDIFQVTPDVNGYHLLTSNPNLPYVGGSGFNFTPNLNCVVYALLYDSAYHISYIKNNNKVTFDYNGGALQRLINVNKDETINLIITLDHGDDLPQDTNMADIVCAIPLTLKTYYSNGLTNRNPQLIYTENEDSTITITFINLFAFANENVLLGTLSPSNFNNTVEIISTIPGINNQTHNVIAPSGITLYQTFLTQGTYNGTLTIKNADLGTEKFVDLYYTI